MKLHTKGISPLIATVLTVGFAITLAVLFWIFASGQVQDVLDKDAAEQAGKAVCAKDVAFTLPSCSVSDTLTSVTLHNTGDVPITAVRMRVSGSLSGTPFTWTPLVEDEVVPGQEKTISKMVTAAGFVAASTSVEVLPVIVYGGHAITCTEQAMTCSG